MGAFFDEDKVYLGGGYDTEKRDIFVGGLVEWGGGTEEAASRPFAKHATHYEIGDPLRFVVAEAVRLQSHYPRLMVAPLLYTVEDDRLTQITNGSG